MLSRRRWIGVCVVCAAAGLGVASVLRHAPGPAQLAGAVVGSIPTLIELLTAAVGLLLIVRFWPGRQGWGVYCKACGYFQEQRGRLAPACPECGATWLWIGNTRRGRPTGAAMPALAGVGLCLLALAGSLMQSARPWAYVRLLPTGVLLSQVTVLPDDSTGELWSELARRNLPVATLDALAEPLLKKKARDGYLSRAAEVVLFDAMMRPTAPPAAAARYFGSFLSATVQTPAAVQEGEQVAHSAAAVFRGRTLTLGSTPRVLVISAMYAGDGAEPIQTWTWTVDPESPEVQKQSMDGWFTAAQPGLLRLRQEFWLAIGPANAGSVGWRDGLPVLPAAMSIKDHFEEVREVRITPMPKTEGAGSVPPG